MGEREWNAVICEREKEAGSGEREGGGAAARAGAALGGACGSCDGPDPDCVLFGAPNLFSHAAVNQRICGRLKAPEMESMAPLLASIAASVADICPISRSRKSSIDEKGPPRLLSLRMASMALFLIA